MQRGSATSVPLSWMRRYCGAARCVCSNLAGNGREAGGPAFIDTLPLPWFGAAECCVVGGYLQRATCRCVPHSGTRRPVKPQKHNCCCSSSAGYLHNVLPALHDGYAIVDMALGALPSAPVLTARHTVNFNLKPVSCWLFSQPQGCAVY